MRGAGVRGMGAVWDDSGDERLPDFMGYTEASLAALLAHGGGGGARPGGEPRLRLLPPPLMRRGAAAGALVVERAAVHCGGGVEQAVSPPSRCSQRPLGAHGSA